MAFRRKVVITALAWSVALVTASPIFLMALTAFKTDAAADLGPFAPFTPTLANFASQNANVGILRPLANSFVEAGGGTVLCLLFALPAAYGLAFHAGRRRNAVLLGMLTTRFMPGVGVMIPMYLISKATGLLDTQIGLERFPPCLTRRCGVEGGFVIRVSGHAGGPHSCRDRCTSTFGPVFCQRSMAAFRAVRRRPTSA